MKVFHNIYIAVLCLILSLGIFTFSFYYYLLSAPSKDSSVSSFEVKPGSVSSIATSLKENDYIRSDLAFKIYIKLTGKSNLKAGVYELSRDMGVKDIVNLLEKGSSINKDEISILFKEGLNISKIGAVIEENTNNSKEDFYRVLEDKEYLNSLISKYWFLSNEVLNDKIYYSLEGYLYPSTYNFSSKDVKSETIIETMLNEMEKQLKDYKDDIEESDKSFHEILTMASIVELEGVTKEDRVGIAGVFYNRIKSGMNLGSDVTTYYGAKINMGDRDLYSSELSECNNYNTRCATFKRLPISPICSPSMDSIIASLNPDTNNYYYFVADKNKKVYFSKNITEHNNTIYRLKKEGLWYEY